MRKAYRRFNLQSWSGEKFLSLKKKLRPEIKWITAGGEGNFRERDILV